MEWRTAGGCRCECGRSLASHQSEPSYFRGERFGAFSSVAERDAGCTEFKYNPNPPDLPGKFRMDP